MTFGKKAGVFILGFLGLACLALLAQGVRHFSAFVDGRPAEELTARILSPDGLHELRVYDNGGKGATVAESSTVIVRALPGGQTWRGKEAWCVYFSYPYAGVTAEWAGEDAVVIRNPLAHPEEAALSIYRDEYFAGR